MRAKSREAVPPIKLQVGAELFIRNFGGKKFVPSLLELIKNCRDWDGQEILINIGADFLEVIDGGNGLNRKNREAFCSTAISTGDQKIQSSKFGTGTKHMLYLCNGVRVITKTAEEDEVISFELRTSDYQHMVLSQSEINVKVLPNSAWSYGFETGTALRYDFSGKSAFHIKDVGRIAEELAQEVPLVVIDAILFNGKPLPRKETKNDKYVRDQFAHDTLGWINFELYSLKGARANKGVYLSSTGMPEVRFIDFLSLLPQKLRTFIPDIYLNTADITGTIHCRDLFRPYINEDRHSFDGTIANSELMMAFIMLLKKKETEIKSMLGLNQKEEDQSLEKMVSDLIQRSAKVYGPATKDDIIGDEFDVVIDDPQTIKPLQIDGARREYEPGQTIELTAKINSDLIDIRPKDLKWLYMNGGLKNVRISKDNLHLSGTITKEFGWRSISIEGGDATGQTQYSIVPRRQPYLSANRVGLNKGDEYKLTCYNIDLVDKKVNWRMTGGGKLEPLGKERQQGSAIFFATKPGEAKIFAEGQLVTGAPFQITCEIVINENKGQPLLQIEGYKFSISAVAAPGNPPIVMKAGNGVDPLTTEHLLFINTTSKIFRNKTKNSKELIFWLVSQEFSRFYYQDINEEGEEINLGTRAKHSEFAEKVLMKLLGE